MMGTMMMGLMLVVRIVSIRVRLVRRQRLVRDASLYFSELWTPIQVSVAAI